MRVLVACEFSGVVRDAFAARGHDAWSCDLLPSERPGQHVVGDVRELLGEDWGLVIAHPPCRYLSRAGDWRHRGSPERAAAIAFVAELFDAPVPRLVIENPRGLNRLWRPASQAIQPWMFGHGETKETLLWLRGVPPLLATVVSSGREQRVARLGPGPERWRERSRTLPGIAAAMAAQWG